MSSVRIAVLALALAGVLAGCGSRGLSPHSGMIDVPGGKVWYQIVGSGSKTPLLLLHGGPGVPSYYLKPLAALADERPVVFYDQLGCGRSPAPDDTSLWKIDRFVQELGAVRKALGLERVHLYGTSWGTILALEYMKTRPSGVESVVMASPALDLHQWMKDADSLLHTLPDSTLKVILAAEKSGAYDSPAYQNAMMAYYQLYIARRQPWSADMDSAFAQMGQSVYMTMDGPSEFQATGTLRDYDGRAFLKELSVPVLYTCGEFDEALPRTVASFAAATPGAEMQIFANAAHCTAEDDSASYVPAIRAFLDRVDARQKGH
jgi:proline-specific peptidase